MEKLPLSLRLRREIHKKLAFAQDIIVEEVYRIFGKAAILHGGTAIWRCFSGKRFSEDLDFYLPKNKEKIEEVFVSLIKRGFVVKKRKISDRSVYSEFEFDRVNVRFEATFQKANGILSDYELCDGNVMSIFSLSSHDFIIEKVDTYLKRLKIRDLWDIYFLSRITEYNSNSLLRGKIKLFVNNYKVPVDEDDLQSIILEGIVPSANDMFNYIRAKLEKGKNIDG